MRPHTFSVVGALILAFVAAPFSLADPYAVLDAALAKHATLTLTGVEFERVRREGNDPVTRERCRGIAERAAECELAEIAGTAPSASQLAQYRDRQTQPVSSELPILEIFEWIDRRSVALSEADPRLLRFAFRANAKSAEAYRREGSMAGFLEVDRASGTLVRITQKNGHNFSPATGVRVKRMEVEVTFDPETALVRSLSLNVEARALGLVAVSQSEAYSFENVVPAVGSLTPAPGGENAP